MRGLFGTLSGAAPRASVQSMSFAEWVERLTGGGPSAAGPVVTGDSALHNPTVLICLRVLAESVAQLPLVLYRQRRDGGWDRATDHPLYEVLHDQANGWLTSFEYREGTMVNLATRGDGLSYVDRDSRGRVIGLVPLNPDGMEITQALDWSPLYSAVMPNNARQKLKPAEVHHIRGPIPKGYRGRSMIGLARDSIGLGLAAEQFGSKLFSSGMKPSGVLSHKGNLSPEAQDRLREQIAKKYSGVENAQKPLLLEEGMTWTALSINPEDAQFLETRKFQRSEIAGIFRVPPHLVNDLERATFSNIEHQSIDFVVHSLMPWLKRWEQAIRRDLLLPNEREAYKAEFLTDGLLRGDMKSRNEAYALQIQNGIRNPNEVRMAENLGPRPGGDDYWKPSNMAGDVPPSA